MADKFPGAVTLIEVGPREGFQFEGIGNPDRIPLSDKIALIDALSLVGLKRLQIASFVHPRAVPQMADAEAVCAGITPQAGVDYTGIYLNDTGMKRALAAACLTFIPELVLSASETFAKRNQRRDFPQDDAMQVELARLCAEAGHPVTTANIMAAFGCNYEGAVPQDRVIRMVGRLCEIAAASGGAVAQVNLADTMGWADPESIRRMAVAFHAAFPGVSPSGCICMTRAVLRSPMSMPRCRKVSRGSTRVSAASAAARLPASRGRPAMSRPRRWCFSAKNSASKPASIWTRLWIARVWRNGLWAMRCRAVC